MAKIYLASGWFNAEQEARVAKVEEILRSLGHDVFSPRENQLTEWYEFGTEEWRTATFKSDVNAIDWCDVIVAVYDQEDAGTMWEVGYAFSTGTTIVLFNEKEKVVNLMLSDSCFAYLQTYEELEKYDYDNPERVPFTGEVL